MREVIEEFEVVLRFQTTVDTETGEITTNCIKKSIDKNVVNDTEVKKSRKKLSKKDEKSTPTLILESNKYSLTTSAIELMQLTPGDKIDIKYEKINGVLKPIIGKDDIFGTKSGNKITLSNTVTFKGTKNEMLSKYGSEFNIINHPTKEGLFLLDCEGVEIPKGDENVNINEETSFNLDLEDFIENEDDSKITEIDSNFFVL